MTLTHISTCNRSAGCHGVMPPGTQLLADYWLHIDGAIRGPRAIRSGGRSSSRFEAVGADRLARADNTRCGCAEADPRIERDARARIERGQLEVELLLARAQGAAVEPRCCTSQLAPPKRPPACRADSPRSRHNGACRSWAARHTLVRAVRAIATGSSLESGSCSTKARSAAAAHKSDSWMQCGELRLAHTFIARQEHPTPATGRGKPLAIRAGALRAAQEPRKVDPTGT
jgi:hypothetical protein